MIGDVTFSFSDLHYYKLKKTKKIQGVPVPRLFPPHDPVLLARVLRRQQGSESVRHMATVEAESRKLQPTLAQLDRTSAIGLHSMPDRLTEFASHQWATDAPGHVEFGKGWPGNLVLASPWRSTFPRVHGTMPREDEIRALLGRNHVTGRFDGSKMYPGL